MPFNEARYGRDFCGGIVCNNTWFLIRDAMAYLGEGAARRRRDDGRRSRRICKTFDVRDRYDFDGDGNFDEPDGFIDHFQIVHAGGDEAAGDPHQGTDAIWCHRWYAAGPAPAARTASRASTPVAAARRRSPGAWSIPNNPTGVWVGDYTIQPENGGLGVFAHEYGARPRPAGSLRHLRQHRWRRELDRLLDAHVVGCEHRRRRP